jgi:hypothetical protein
MNGRRVPSRIAGLGLTLALMIGLSHTPALADLPVGCGAAALTPIRPPPGWQIIAKGSIDCTVPRLMRLRVRLQRLVDGVWVDRAFAIGVSEQPINSLTVVASGPCRIGIYRTRVAIRLRDALSDPWVVALRFNSPRRTVGTCPS